MIIVYSKFFIAHKLDLLAVGAGTIIAALIAPAIFGNIYPLSLEVGSMDIGLLAFMLSSYGFIEAKNPFKVPE